MRHPDPLQTSKGMDRKVLPPPYRKGEKGGRRPAPPVDSQPTLSSGVRPGGPPLRVLSEESEVGMWSIRTHVLVSRPRWY